MPTASIYVRLSKESGTRNTSLAGMVSDCRSLAEREGLTVTAEHVDDGVSGAVRNRPAFLAWLADGREGRAEVLLTYDGDRLTREGANVVAMVLDVVEGKDAKTGKAVRPPVRFLDFSGLDSENGDAFRLTFLVKAEGARMERNAIQRRNLDTQRRLRDAGRFTGGAIPYGTRVEIRVGEDGREGRHLVENPEEAAHLREAASWLIRGDSLRAITARMNARGWTTRRGYPWQRASVRSTLLSAPSREFVFDTATNRAIAERLTSAGTAAKGAPGRPSSFLILDLATCAGCGRRMRTRSYTHGGKRRRVYICPAVSDVTPCPERVTISAEPADLLAEELFLARFGSFEYMEPRVMLSGAEDLNAAEEAVEKAQVALLADPTNPTHGKALVEARSALQALRAAPVRHERTLVSTGLTVAQVWAESQLPERAGLLADALETIAVRPARDYPATRGGTRRGGAVMHPERLGLIWRAATSEVAVLSDYGHGESAGPGVSAPREKVTA